MGAAALGALEECRFVQLFCGLHLTAVKTSETVQHATQQNIMRKSLEMLMLNGLVHVHVISSFSCQ